VGPFSAPISHPGWVPFGRRLPPGDGAGRRSYGKCRVEEPTGERGDNRARTMATVAASIGTACGRQPRHFSARRNICQIKHLRGGLSRAPSARLACEFYEYEEDSERGAFPATAKSDPRPAGWCGGRMFSGLVSRPASAPDTCDWTQDAAVSRASGHPWCQAVSWPLEKPMTTLSSERRGADKEVAQ